jgi:uncharacterized protein YdaL
MSVFQAKDSWSEKKSKSMAKREERLANVSKDNKHNVNVSKMSQTQKRIIQIGYNAWINLNISRRVGKTISLKFVTVNSELRQMRCFDESKP